MKPLWKRPLQTEQDVAENHYTSKGGCEISHTGHTQDEPCSLKIALLQEQLFGLIDLYPYVATKGSQVGQVIPQPKCPDPNCEPKFIASTGTDGTVGIASNITPKTFPQLNWKVEKGADKTYPPCPDYPHPISECGFMSLNYNQNPNLDYSQNLPQKHANIQPAADQKHEHCCVAPGCYERCDHIRPASQSAPFEIAGEFMRKEAVHYERRADNLEGFAKDWAAKQDYSLANECEIKARFLKEIAWDLRTRYRAYGSE
jgi:hypothetical protein